MPKSTVMGEATKVPSPPQILDTAPPHVIEALADALVDDPGMVVKDYAEKHGLPVGTCTRLARSSRFCMIVARRAANELAKSGLPQAVQLLRETMQDPDNKIAASTKVNAAAIVLQHGKRYLEGHLDREKEEEELSKLSLDDLRDLVRQSEQRLAHAAKDVTPNDAPNATPSVADDVLKAME